VTGLRVGVLLLAALAVAGFASGWGGGPMFGLGFGIGFLLGIGAWLVAYRRGGWP
jgi:hypothetical protein